MIYVTPEHRNIKKMWRSHRHFKCHPSIVVYKLFNYWLIQNFQSNCFSLVHNSGILIIITLWLVLHNWIILNSISIFCRCFLILACFFGHRLLTFSPYYFLEYAIIIFDIPARLPTCLSPDCEIWGHRNCSYLNISLLHTPVISERLHPWAVLLSWLMRIFLCHLFAWVPHLCLYYE